MLTATTPFAHEFRDDSSAESPPKLAPYPREVGTQTMGRPTSPPTTEKKAPSIPATVMTTSARSISSSLESSRTTPATPTSATTCDSTPRYASVRLASSAT
jgi:hypothetical protein